MGAGLDISAMKQMPPWSVPWRSARSIFRIRCAALLLGVTAGTALPGCADTLGTAFAAGAGSAAAPAGLTRDSALPRPRIPRIAIRQATPQAAPDMREAHPVQLAQGLPDSAPPQGGPIGENPFASDPPETDISGFADLARPALRAQISPRRQTVLSAEIAGKIDSYPLREGERFDEGDPLVGFDCAVHSARRDRSRAMEQSARRRLETAGRLDQLNSISRLEYDEAVAALAVAEAETALSEIAVARCTIEAPFPGRVAERLADPFQFVAEGEPVIAILDDRDLEVALMMPSRWLAWVKPGHGFSVAIDELGTTLEARIARIGARVDPISQSIRVFGAITDAPEGLMAGMSGEADLRPPDHHQDGAR